MHHADSTLWGFRDDEGEKGGFEQIMEHGHRRVSKYIACTEERASTQ